MELTVCPECAEPAEIQWRAVLESTDGPIEHARVLCVRTHWFLLPTADLERLARPVPARRSATHVAAQPPSAHPGDSPPT
jgi:hypothetical protein